MKALALAVLGAASAAHADRLDTSVGLLSDKIVRGLSQSQGDASLVADAAWRADTGWALSAGLATLGRRNPRGEAELTLAAGLGGLWSERWEWQASAVRYQTLGRATRRPAYAELSGSASWDGRLQLTLALSPDYPGLPNSGPRRGQARVGEAGWHQPVGQGWSFDAGIGQVDYRRIGFASYRYGSLGIGWAGGPWQVVASRVFSDSAAGSAAQPRLVLSVLWRLSP